VLSFLAVLPICMRILSPKLFIETSNQVIYWLMMTSIVRSLILVWPNCLVLVKVISQLESTFGLVSSFCFFWFYSSSSILHVLVFWILQSSTSGVLFYYFGVKTWSRSLHYYIISHSFKYSTVMWLLNMQILVSWMKKMIFIALGVVLLESITQKEIMWTIAVLPKRFVILHILS